MANTTNPRMSLRISIVLLIVSASLAGNADPSLVGWWKLDDGSGTVAVDSSGNGYNIPLQHATWEDGIFGGAAHFHGVGHGGTGGFSYSATAITVCAWVRHDAFRIGKVERYVTVGPETAVIRKEGNGRLHFYIKTDGNLKHLWVSGVLAEDSWHHVAGTWDGTTQRLYIDGAEIADSRPGGVLDGTTNVGLSSGAEAVNGMLDDVRVYTRALTRSEIQVLIQAEDSPYAFNPFPPDGAISVETDVTLSWTPGPAAQMHRVYFGDDFDSVNGAEGATAQIEPSFTPGPLEPGKTYYWRVDEFDLSDWHKGDVWNFTTARPTGQWAYDGGIMVGTYYYPWYGPTAHRVSASLRGHLVPRQTAELGEYESGAEEVIARHIDYSHRANIHFWACSWWGPGTNEDRIIRNRILPHPYAGELRYAIMYESTGRLGSFANPDYSNLSRDFRYFADNCFGSANYLKIDDVRLSSYISRGCTFATLRATMPWPLCGPSFPMYT